jgi:hypothetical protein
VLPLEVKHESHKKQKYHCANPNCNRFFSRPKIIKYYVCPTCQTLVSGAEENEQLMRVPLSPQKQVRQTKSKKIQTGIKPEPEIIITNKTEDSPPIAQELKVLEEKSETNKNLNLENARTSEQKTETVKMIIVPEQTQSPQPKVITAIPTQPISEETKTASPSSSDCQYGFGYLSQREKGEGIPDSCIECSRSLSCMLSEYYKKEEIKEIKKWYSF